MIIKHTTEDSRLAFSELNRYLNKHEKKLQLTAGTRTMTVILI